MGPRTSILHQNNKSKGRGGLSKLVEAVELNHPKPTPPNFQTNPAQHLSLFLAIRLIDVQKRLINSIAMACSTTEGEFSFPIITETHPSSIDSPPLWHLSPAASPNHHSSCNKLSNEEYCKQRKSCSNIDTYHYKTEDDRSFIYWQRQILCSFNLLQQIAEGAFAPVIALAHGLSSNGLQVMAPIDNSASLRSRTNTMQIAAYEIFMVILIT